jgi:hypothetical protein
MIQVRSEVVLLGAWVSLGGHCEADFEFVLATLHASLRKIL